jgi:hypothetical protein
MPRNDVENKVFDTVQNYIFQDGYNYIFNLPKPHDGGGKPKPYSPYHGRRKSEIAGQYLDRIRELSIEEEPRKPKKRGKKRKTFIPEPRTTKKVPAKLREVLPFSLEKIEFESGFDLASLFEEEAEQKAFEHLDAYRREIQAKRDRIAVLAEENAKRQLLARQRKELRRAEEEWRRLKEQIEKVLIVKALRAREEQELLLILGQIDEDLLLLIN